MVRVQVERFGGKCLASGVPSVLYKRIIMISQQMGGRGTCVAWELGFCQCAVASSASDADPSVRRSC
jgi:hypothetical protein